MSHPLKRNAFVIIGISLGVLSSASVRSQASEAALRGIKTVTVNVDRVPPTAVKAGITDRAVLDNVRHALRDGGIAIEQSVGDAQLTVTINAVEIQTSSKAIRGLAFTVSVSVDQDATLTRIPITSRLSTWRRAGIGVGGGSKAKDVLYAQLTEYLDAFVAARNAANPRP